jgi:hypothetical protein
MPPGDGAWLNHPGQTEKARPEPGHPHQQRAIPTFAAADVAVVASRRC